MHDLAKRRMVMNWLVFCGLFMSVHIASAQSVDVQPGRVDEIAAILPDVPHALAPPCSERAAWSPLALPSSRTSTRQLHYCAGPFQHGVTTLTWTICAYVAHHISANMCRCQLCCHAA